MTPNFCKQLFLILCLIDFGAIIGTGGSGNYVDEKGLPLILSIWIIVGLIIFAQACKNLVAASFVPSNQREIFETRLADMKRLYRQRINSLNMENSNLKKKFQVELANADGKFEDLSREYDWLANKYMDAMHLTEEQGDRIAYLEGKLQEFGQLTSGARPPFSAPSSKIAFSEPPSRKEGPPSPNASMPESPLEDVSEPEETET